MCEELNWKRAEERLKGLVNTYIIVISPPYSDDVYKLADLNRRFERGERSKDLYDAIWRFGEDE